MCVFPKAPYNACLCCSGEMCVLLARPFHAGFKSGKCDGECFCSCSFFLMKNLWWAKRAIKNSVIVFLLLLFLNHFCLLIRHIFLQVCVLNVTQIQSIHSEFLNYTFCLDFWRNVGTEVSPHWTDLLQLMAKWRLEPIPVVTEPHFVGNWAFNTPMSCKIYFFELLSVL